MPPVSLLSEGPGTERVRPTHAHVRPALVALLFDRRYGARGRATADRGLRRSLSVAPGGRARRPEEARAGGGTVGRSPMRAARLLRVGREEALAAVRGNGGVVVAVGRCAVVCPAPPGKGSAPPRGVRRALRGRPGGVEAGCRHALDPGKGCGGRGGGVLGVRLEGAPWPRTRPLAASAGACPRKGSREAWPPREGGGVPCEVAASRSIGDRRTAGRFAGVCLRATDAGARSRWAAGAAKRSRGSLLALSTMEGRTVEVATRQGRTEG